MKKIWVLAAGLLLALTGCNESPKAPSIDPNPDHPSDQTLLIAHNIDIGERVPAGVLNQTIYANGEYVWNDQGGLLHWTHIDPAGSHADGWIYYQGKQYQ